jgi:hypothetical protein
LNYVIKGPYVYTHEEFEGGTIDSLFGPVYRVAAVNSVKSWEQFDTKTSKYIPAPEYTHPFPEDPPAPKDLQIEVDDLKALVSAQQTAIDFIIMNF